MVQSEIFNINLQMQKLQYHALVRLASLLDPNVEKLVCLEINISYWPVIALACNIWVMWHH